MAMLRKNEPLYFLDYLDIVGFTQVFNVSPRPIHLTGICLTLFLLRVRIIYVFGSLIVVTVTLTGL
jgi:hypothetical protein